MYDYWELKKMYEELKKENKMLQHSLWEEQELNEYLQDKIDKLNNYIEKMSYQAVVDNPKKDLTKILKKDNNYEN